MRAANRMGADGAYEVEVLRDDGERIAALRVYPGSEGSMNFYDVDVLVRDESELTGPRNMKWREGDEAYSFGREVASLPLLTPPEAA